MNKVEEEVILLKAVWDLIDSIVNFDVFELQGIDPDAQIMFHRSSDQKYFNIVLTDLLSRTDKKAPIRQTSYLAGLRAICADPTFDVNGSVRSLQAAVDAFTRWLEQAIEVEIWMPSLDKQVKLGLTRIGFLKMCGDLSKHNFLRAIGVAEELRDLLAKSGVDVSVDDALRAFEDFYARFHDDILNYHSSTIAEFLNDIRWGVYQYLQPEFKQNLVWESRNPPKYRYTYPTQVVSSLGKHCYWEIMNDVRREPYMRKFRVTQYLKLRY
jgi:hypothetical protein